MVVSLVLGLLGQQVRGDYTFAVVPKRMNSPYWQSVKSGCQTRARVLSNLQKINITCLFTGPPEGGPETEANQLALLEEMLAKHKDGTQKIDGLALAVVEAPTGTEIINKLTDAGIPTFTFDSDAVDSKRLAYIGTNNYAMGAELGRVLLQVKDNDDQLAAGATFGMIAAGSPNIALRVQGIRDVLTTAGWTEVSTSPKNCVGDAATAVKQMFELVEHHPTITAILPVGAWPMMEGEMWMDFVDAHRRVCTIVGDSLQSQIDLMNMGYANALVGTCRFVPPTKIYYFQQYSPFIYP